MNERLPYTGEYVILALNLRDAWKAAKRHDLAPERWLYLREPAQVHACPQARVVVAKNFRHNPRAAELRAAVEHLHPLPVAA